MTSHAWVRDLAAWRWTLPALAAVLCFVGLFVQVGADWDWLVALGDHVRSTRSVPDDVPFAAADTEGWHNVLVLAEVLASMLHDVGPWTVGALHLVLVSAGLLVLAVTARRSGSADHVVAAAMLLLCVGSLSALAVVRLQTWSLLMFPVLLSLLRSQSRRPDRRVWWAPVVVAVWGNLHGAVLLGVCVLGCYLVLHRLRQRPAETVAVGVASLLALCLTPQLWTTPLYYAGVLGNESATRAVGLWARPSVGDGADVAMLVAGAAMATLVLRRRLTAWEYVALLGLAVSTASAARHGVWLLCLLVALLPPARDSDVTAGATSAVGDRRRGDAVGAGMAALATAVIVVAVVWARGDVHAVDARVVDAVEQASAGGVVLAPAPLVESLAVRGVTVWAGNPLDAFGLEDQAAYLDFLDRDAVTPGMVPAVDGSDVVVVERGSALGEELAGTGSFDQRSCGPGWTCLVRQ